MLMDPCSAGEQLSPIIGPKIDRATSQGGGKWKPSVNSSILIEMKLKM